MYGSDYAYLHLFRGDEVQEVGLVLFQPVHHVPHLVLFGLFSFLLFLLLLKSVIETSVIHILLGHLHGILCSPNLGNTSLVRTFVDEMIR